MIQLKDSINQADRNAVPRKHTSLSVDHLLERFVFHTDTFITAQLLTGMLFVRKMGRKEWWISKHSKNIWDNCENLLRVWVWGCFSLVKLVFKSQISIWENILMCED